MINSFELAERTCEETHEGKLITVLNLIHVYHSNKVIIFKFYLHHSSTLK